MRTSGETGKKFTWEVLKNRNRQSQVFKVWSPNSNYSSSIPQHSTPVVPLNTVSFQNSQTNQFTPFGPQGPKNEFAGWQPQPDMTYTLWVTSSKLEHSIIFHSYGDVTITGEGVNFGPCPAAMTPGQWGFFSVTHLPWHGESVYNDHIRAPMTLAAIREGFGSGAFTTCFNDWGLSRLGFELPTYRLHGECSNPLRHRCGSTTLTTNCEKFCMHAKDHYVHK